MKLNIIKKRTIFQKKEVGTNDKYCPDLTGFEIRESYLRGGGTNKTVILNHCLKDACVAYKNGKCIKYNSNVEIKEGGDK